MAATFRNVVVWDASRSAAELCDVSIENGMVKAVSQAEGEVKNGDFDGKGKTALIPGFVNAHGHAAMSLLRGLGEELPLMDWLEKRIWPVEARLDGDLVRAGTDLAILEMLASGTTCFADMYFFMDRVAEASLDAGIRCGLSRGIIYDGSDGKLNENLTLAKDFNGEKGLVNIQLGPHAPYTVPFDYMKKVAGSAAENGLGVQLHWLETESEWQLLDLPRDLTPEKYLEESGLLEVSNLLLAHCVWTDPERAEFYARSNVTVAHNPKSNLKLGSGVAPVPEMLAMKVRLAIGTDGAASNNRLDMWDEMRFAALLQKGVRRDPTLMAAKDVLAMATYGGAQGLGFKNCGHIREGCNADMILIDLDRPHYMGWDFESLPWYIVYAGSSEDILMTVVAGKTLYERGEFKTLDEEAVKARALEARKRLTAA
jgi:5-methylthioadenosine/S-adenosylhomocysteine deaminase